MLAHTEKLILTDCYFFSYFFSILRILTTQHISHCAETKAMPLFWGFFLALSFMKVQFQLISIF